MNRFALFLALTILAVSGCDNPMDTLTPEPNLAMLAMDNTLTGDAQFTTSVVFPSTNEENYYKTPTRWAHVLWVDLPEVPPGQVTLDFVSERSFLSCFEYRIDDEAPAGDTNYNSYITDGLWAFTCQNNSSSAMTFQAAQHVDVRMGFGAETDERFDWTRFYVLSLENKDQCREGQWEAMGFKNQGQCVRYVETGKDSRVGQ